MGQVGQFALALAFVVTIYSIGASLLGIRIKNDKLIASGRNAAVAVFVLISTAIGTLAYLFLTSDFSYAYVAEHSNRDLPIYFKISSIWGGQEGSLLFWGWLLTIYSALVVIQNRTTAHVDDAVRHGSADGHVAVLHGDASVRGESVPAERRCRSAPRLSDCSTRPTARG